MKYSIIAFIVAVALSGCSDDKEKTAVDQCLHREIFNDLLKNARSSPLAIGESGDWSTVVYRLEMASRDMSTRKIYLIKPECMGKP